MSLDESIEKPDPEDTKPELDRIYYSKAKRKAKIRDLFLKDSNRDNSATK